MSEQGLSWRQDAFAAPWASGEAAFSLSPAGYRRAVQAGAWYDLLTVAPLVSPWSFALLLSVMSAIHEALGLPGALPAYDPTVSVFANLLGSLALMWAILRLRSPEARFGRYDAACRVLYSAWMLHALLNGFSPVLLVYLVCEIALGVLQAAPVRDAQPLAAE
jgi:hypothetical protein